MKKIHVTRQGHFLDKVYGSMSTKFKVCIVVRLPGGVTQINKALTTYTRINISLCLTLESKKTIEI